MSWDEFLESTDPESLQSLIRHLKYMLEWDREFYGQELIKQLEKDFNRGFATDCLYLLLDSGMITTENVGRPSGRLAGRKLTTI